MTPPLGIQHSLEVVQDLGRLATTGIELAKHGVGLRSLRKLWDMAEDAKELFDDARAALPELKDLDPEEAGQLARECYLVVRKVIDAVAAA